MDQRFVTAAEVAAELRVSRATVVRWCQSGDLPASRFGNAYRVAVEDYEAFKTAAKVGP